MTLYHVKSTPFEAIQWTVDNFSEVADFVAGNVAITADMSCVVVNGQTVCENDWITKFTGQELSDGPVVTRYSVIPNVLFESNYEPVPEGYYA